IAGAIDQVIAEAESQGVRHVFWLTYRTDTAYVLPGGLEAATLYSSHNSELTAAAAQHSSLTILDWDGFTAGRADWFAADGVHLTMPGAVGLANFIKAALDSVPSIGRCRTPHASTGSLDSVPQPMGPALCPSG